MTTEQWIRVEGLFEAALERPPAERAAWVESACEDEVIRAETLAMLTAYARSAPFLEEPATVAAADLVADADLGSEDDDVGARVGPYRLLEEIGRGGMGVVYRAERADGQFEQQVAVKLLRRDIRTDAFQARFLAERQILARLQHPGIARLLDGGITAEGRPFYVMECVEGRPLDRYCDDERLGIGARLRLFLQVCEAVAYAHQSLVVHRDLKPSNILVIERGGQPRAKLLDFGIAKLLDAEGFAATQTEHRLLTPAYAAPEQIRGEPVTTATDVYALGVLLYVLLTGHRPLRIHGRSRHAIEEAILNETPTAPSDRVEHEEEQAGDDGGTEAVTPEAVAQARDSEATRLRRRLRGDLDRIVLKALHKEPARRYASAEAFGRDVERHLAGLPVEARRATVGYRLASFVRRHRTGIAVTAAVLLLAVVGGLFYTARVAAERDRAEQQAARAEHVSEFLIDMLARADEPSTDASALLRLMEPAIARADSELARDPDAQAAVLHTLGRLYARAGRPDRAEPILRRSLALRQRRHPAPHPDVAAAHYALGLLALGTDSAHVFFQHAAETYRAALDGDDHDLAWSLLQWGRTLPQGHPGKRPHYDEALAMLRRLHGPRSPEAAEAMHEFYVLGLGGGTPEEVEGAFREALAIYRENGMERHPYTLHAMYNLGLMLEGRGAHDEAFPLFRLAIEIGREVLAPATGGMPTMMTNFGASLHEAGQLAEADSVLREVTTVTLEVLPDSAGAIGHSHYWYGRNLLALERLDEAAAALRLAERIHAYHSEGTFRHYRTQVELGEALRQQGQFEEAERHLRAAAGGLGGTDLEPLALRRLLALYADAGHPGRAAPYRARLDELGG